MAGPLRVLELLVSTGLGGGPAQVRELVRHLAPAELAVTVAGPSGGPYARIFGEGGMPFACAGISMGGFGALLYARRRAERATRPAAVAAISPALITTWQEMSSRNAFRDAADWASMDPLKHVETLAGVPVGVWCGVEDPFVEGTRKFIAAAKPEIGYTGPGGHADSFYRRVAPDVIGFLGRRLRQHGQTIIGQDAGTQD